MAEQKIDSVLTASAFRSNLFEHLNAAASGHPVSIRYKDAEYQLIAVKREGKLERYYSAGPAEPVISDPADQLFSDDPELKQEREREWTAKWQRRLKTN